MIYEITIMPEAAFDLQRLAKSDPEAFAKANPLSKSWKHIQRQG